VRYEGNLVRRLQPSRLRALVRSAHRRHAGRRPGPLAGQFHEGGHGVRNEGDAARRRFRIAHRQHDGRQQDLRRRARGRWSSHRTRTARGEMKSIVPCLVFVVATSAACISEDEKPATTHGGAGATGSSTGGGAGASASTTASTTATGGSGGSAAGG